MRKVGLFLGSTPNSGGMFQYCQSVLDAFAALPDSEYIKVVAYLAPLWEKYLEPYSLQKVQINSDWWGVPFSKAWRTLWLPNSLLRKLGPRFHPIIKGLIKQSCELWVFPTQDPWIYQAPVAALGVVHDLMHRYERRFPEVSSWGRYSYRESHFKNICRWAKTILVDSEIGKQQVHESYGIPLHKVFPLPYIPPKYIFESAVSKDFDVKYPLPRKFIFYPAQFWKHKNHTNLLDALSKVRKDISDIQLVLVGSKKNAYFDVIELIKRQNLEEHVRIFGYVPDRDIPEFYRRARALIMPTFFGPTNIPQLEAFALGCPVATSRIYGIPAQVGDAALLFDPEDTIELSEVIKRLWVDDELCQRLIAEGMKRSYSWGPIQFNQRFSEILSAMDW